MNGFIKEEHDSDVEVLDPDILKKHWLQNQVCLAKQLMTCGKPIPVKWFEFEAFVQENIDWQPSFSLIHAIWTKMCKIEENIDTTSRRQEENSCNQLSTVAEGNESFFTQSHPEESRLVTKKLKLPDEQIEVRSPSGNNILRYNCSEQSDSSHSSSHKRKNKKKRKSDLLHPESLERKIEPSVDVSSNDNYSLLSTTSFSSKKSEEVDLNDPPPEIIVNKKKKRRNKNSVELSEQCCQLQNIKQESFDDEESSSNEKKSQLNDLSPPSFTKRKKMKKSKEMQGASSSAESDSNFLNESMASLENESFSSQNNASRKKKGDNIPDEDCTTLNNSKRKKKTSDVMSEAEAEALREELLADRIIELELPKVIKEMKGALTKIDKCITNLEIKGKLSKLDKQLSKLENKSLIKKLEKKKKVRQ